MNPEVTIAIPCFNAASTLPMAISSVFAQSYESWRLVIVDDGSTDQTVALAQSVVDPRVSVIADGQHLGLSRRLNQIAEACQSPFLARMDADDAMHPERMEKQI